MSTSKRVASLSGAALRLEALREDGRAELVDLLESLPGNKCLVLESHIGGLLNHVIPEGSKVCVHVYTMLGDVGGGERTESHETHP